jgi:hypothetical protein
MEGESNDVDAACRQRGIITVVSVVSPQEKTRYFEPFAV